MPYAHLFAALSQHLEAIIVSGGYPFLFLIVLLEGLPLIGTAVPGHITIIAAGFLARLGVLDLTWVLIVSISAAIAGDYIGFILGRRFGLDLIRRLRPYFFIKDAHIEKAQSLLDRHTGKAMIIGRFSPLTRALTPFLVGASRTSTTKFWIYNLIGGISWAVLSVILGYVFGSGYDAIAGHFGKVAMIGILIAILIIWGYRFVNSRFHIFKKYELFTLALNVISLWVLAETIMDTIAFEPFMANFDIWVNIFMSGHNGSFLIGLATWISTIGGAVVVGIVSTIASVSLLIRHRWRSAAILILSMGSTVLSVGIFKEFIMRSRPEDAIFKLMDPSFPSAHAALSAALIVIVTYLAVYRIKSWVMREMLLVISVLGIVVIGLSRIVLNVHWLSDVIAGWSLGIFLATASILLVRYVSVLVMKKSV